jgi:hypothetical protein
MCYMPCPSRPLALITIIIFGDTTNYKVVHCATYPSVSISPLDLDLLLSTLFTNTVPALPYRERASFKHIVYKATVTLQFCVSYSLNFSTDNKIN